MVDVEPVEPLMRKIVNRYNRKPEGWKVVTDRKGNVLILGPEAGYSLRLVPINPQVYSGVGVKIGGVKDVRRDLQRVPSYGFRPLSGRETKQLFSAIQRKGTMHNELVKKLLRMKPVPTSRLQRNNPRAILTGPVITHPNLAAISKSQRKLQKKLASEANKLFRKEHPQRAAIYR